MEGGYGAVGAAPPNAPFIRCDEAGPSDLRMACAYSSSLMFQSPHKRIDRMLLFPAGVNLRCQVPLIGALERLAVILQVRGLGPLIEYSAQQVPTLNELPLGAVNQTSIVSDPVVPPFQLQISKCKDIFEFDDAFPDPITVIAWFTL